MWKWKSQSWPLSGCSGDDRQWHDEVSDGHGGDLTGAGTTTLGRTVAALSERPNCVPSLIPKYPCAAFKHPPTSHSHLRDDALFVCDVALFASNDSFCLSSCLGIISRATWFTFADDGHDRVKSGAQRPADPGSKVTVFSRCASQSTGSPGGLSGVSTRSPVWRLGFHNRSRRFRCRRGCRVMSGPGCRCVPLLGV